MPKNYVKVPVREVEWDLANPAKPEAKENNLSFILTEEQTAQLNAKLPIHWLLKRSDNDLKKMKELAEKIDKDEIQLFFGNIERIETPPGVLQKMEGASDTANLVRQVLEALKASAGSGGSSGTTSSESAATTRS